MPNRKLNDAFMLRFPDGMRGEIKALASANNKSMNSEIIFHLSKVISSTVAESKQEHRPDVHI